MSSSPSSTKKTDYTGHYKASEVDVYPSEFLVRAFLGTYEKPKIDHKLLRGKKVLDLGFGDGRNFQLLHDLGMELYGTEITESICKLITERLYQRKGISVDARVGRNTSIPFANSFFDCIVASSSSYYMDEGNKYEDNLAEIHRVLKPGGLFIHSLPMPSTFIMRNAIDTGEGHMRITEDPYGVRVGTLMKQFKTEDEVRSYLTHGFKDISIGSAKDDFWGDAVHLWLVVCTKT